MSKETLFAVGDCFLNSEFWDSDPIGPNLKTQISESSLAICNLEGSQSIGEPINKLGPNLNFGPDTVSILSESGFDAVSLANNHSMDYGKKGLKSVIDDCFEKNLSTFGAGKDKTEAIKPIGRTIGSTSVCVIGLTEHREQISSENDAGTAYIYDYSIPNHLEELNQKYDIVVAMVHGGIEYTPLPPHSWRSHLRELAKSGVDVIIGHHPHNPQGWEIFNNSCIFYSLGNWLMYNDKFASTHWSYAVSITLEDGAVSDVSMQFTEALDGKVKSINNLNKNRRKYIDVSSRIVSNNEEYNEYWNLLAERLFYERYENKFEVYGSSLISKLISDPVGTIDDITKYTGQKSNVSADELRLLDFVHNQSHLDVVQNVLENRTNYISNGTEPNSEVLDNLIEIAEDRVERGSLDRNLDRFNIIMDRIIN